MQTALRNKDVKIAVLCGGMSSEREVSLRSGKNCHAALLRLGYKRAKLVDVKQNIANELKDFDIAYNALHGRYGEDGCIQGLLEILKIPYTGCGVMSSAICMNKEYTKKVLSTDKEIPLIKSVYVKKGEDVVSAVKGLQYPLITKPVSEGSSFGMTKVNKPDELLKAYEEAVKYNNDVLIEEFIDGFFVTVGVLERNGKTFATEILEIRTKTEWYDFDAKYTKGLSEFIVPATGLSSETTGLTKRLAVKSHILAGCSGVSRVDFMIRDDRPYFLEINTSPGMTDTSDLPAQAQAIGISYDELVKLILESAGLNK
ncbi:MAG: D-alanine--D-alanine ligase [Candidatus Gastranaerophilales bacterium]|nr:D-alanine--D-alanine ligase [Candidatus Gastranaerophilales bacterium]